MNWYVEQDREDTVAYKIYENESREAAIENKRMK